MTTREVEFRDEQSVIEWYTAITNTIKVELKSKLVFTNCHFHLKALAGFSTLRIHIGSLYLTNCTFHGDASLLLKMLLGSNPFGVFIKGCTADNENWVQVGRVLSQINPLIINLTELPTNMIGSLVQGLSRVYELKIHESTLPIIPLVGGKLTIESIRFSECIFPPRVGSFLKHIQPNAVQLEDCSGEGMVEEVGQWISHLPMLKELTLSYQGNWLDGILAQLPVQQDDGFTLTVDRCTLTATTFGHLKRILRPFPRRTYQLLIQGVTVEPVELTTFLKGIQFYDHVHLVQLAYMAGQYLRDDADVVQWFKDRQQANTDFLQSLGRSSLPEEMKAAIYLRSVGPFPKDLIKPPLVQPPPQQGGLFGDIPEPDPFAEFDHPPLEEQLANWHV
jgi:hypothetical protein